MAALAILIYRLLQWIGFPFIVVYFLSRALRSREYRKGFAERLGWIPFVETPPGGIWLHAVSVGEVISAAGLLRALRESLPGAPLYLSTTTVAGRAVAAERLKGLADGVFYAPLDYVFAVRSVLRRLRPRAVVVMETEIWPNLWLEARRAGCALLVVNGRISDKALPRYRKLRWFLKTVLPLPDAILTQSEASRDRFMELGAKEAFSAGNLKYDFKPAAAPPPDLSAWLEQLRPRHIWIAASTMPPAAAGDPDEDDAVAAAFHQVAAETPGLLTILVPRKPERFHSAAELLRQQGIPFVRRSQLGAADELPLPGVLLLDSMGELSSLFGLADVVFMGGSLARRGGHNVLEPAVFGKAVIVGPHMENFAEIAAKFEQGGGLVRIAEAAELAGSVLELLRDEPRRAAIGARARELAESERGATARAAGEIVRRYWMALPQPPSAARWLLWPLTLLWRAGAALKRRMDLSRQARLETPVVSVGGLSVGGAGKTPVVLWLARRLSSPAILTRGYRRRSSEPVIAAAGQMLPVSQTGDEAQVYLRAGVGPVGIGADRAANALAMIAHHRPKVFLLDDGFQHHRLHRDFDLVVLDGLDPFAGGAVLPLGRLREPVQALRRADAVVITRVEQAGGVVAAVREAGFSGPVFIARVAPAGWTDASTGEPAEPPGECGAFCGLGNPGSFWRTLQQAGIQPKVRRAFPDHHAYEIDDLTRLAAITPAWLTTEKDLANLPPEWERSGLRILWLSIRLELPDGDDLISRIERRLRS